MINFRFHLVSLIAVFLALAVGIVMGYGVLGQPTVDELQRRIDSVEARSRQIRSENDRLRDDLDVQTDFSVDSAPFAVGSRLTGSKVVLVAVRGVDDTGVVETVRLVRRAGGDISGIVWLEGRFTLGSRAEMSDLAAALNLSVSVSASSLRTAAWNALAVRLTGAPPTGGRTDVLEALVAAKFVTIERIDDLPFEPLQFDGRGARSVLVFGPAQGVPIRQVGAGLTRAFLAQRSLVTVAEVWAADEDGPERGRTIEAVWGDEDLRDVVSTVDTLDTPPGRVATVLAVAALGRGQVGHFGVGAGAEQPMPDWWPV